MQILNIITPGWGLDLEASTVLMKTLDFTARILVAAILGAFIGYEREVNNRPAGLRTHTLVAVASALIMLVSKYGLAGSDPGRLAAQVVSGVGFIGAGAIMHNRSGNRGITGITTAATLWIVSGLGLAAGSGELIGAIITTILVMLILVFFRVFERGLDKSKILLHFSTINFLNSINKINLIARKYEIKIIGLTSKKDENFDNQQEDITIKIIASDKIMFSKFISDLKREINLTNINISSGSKKLSLDEFEIID